MLQKPTVKMVRQGLQIDQVILQAESYKDLTEERKEELYDMAGKTLNRPMAFNGTSVRVKSLSEMFYMLMAFSDFSPSCEFDLDTDYFLVSSGAHYTDGYKYRKDGSYIYR